MIEWRDSCLTFKIPSGFKFNESDYLFKTLIVQNEGYNLNFLESISLLGPCLYVLCVLSGWYNEWLLQGWDAFRIYNVWQNYILFFGYLRLPLMQRKKCTSIPFFSLVSPSIPWFHDVGWPVCKCSQSMALFLNTSYLLLATFEQSYHLFSHTGCLRSLLLASLMEVTYLFYCPDSWTQRFFKRMGRHSWDFSSLCWTLSSEPFSWWIKKSQKQDEGDRNNINLVNSQLPLPCSGEEHGQYWSVSWHPCQSFGLGFLQQPLVHAQAMLGPLVTYLHLSLRLQVLYKRLS